MRKLILFIAAAVTAMTLGGCVNPQFAESIDALRDDSFTAGCVTDEIRARGGLGIWGQSGDMEASVCKLKCSPVLPPGYCFEYNNPATGCKAKAGTGCDGNAPQPVIIVEPPPPRPITILPVAPPRPKPKPKLPVHTTESKDFDPFGKAPKEF